MEVLGPAVPPWMKESGACAGQRVDPSKIRPLPQIASMAGKREIDWIVRATMLPGDNMLDVMTQFAVALAEQAVLASVSSPLANEGPPLGASHGRESEVSRRNAFCFRIEIKSVALISDS